MIPIRARRVDFAEHDQNTHRRSVKAEELDPGFAVHADLLLVTGPVSKHMELALRRTYEATPDPKLVIAVGDCGCSGGIFGESYASRGRVANVICLASLRKDSPRSWLIAINLQRTFDAREVVLACGADCLLSAPSSLADLLSRLMAFARRSRPV